MKIKHPNLKKLHKKAWDLQSKYIRQLEKGICFTCGAKNPWKDTDLGHYIHKNCLDFNKINLHCQCTRCNKFLHGNLGVYAERLIAEYGEEVVTELRVLAGQTKKFTLTELEGFISYYSQSLTELKVLEGME